MADQREGTEIMECSLLKFSPSIQKVSKSLDGHIRKCEQGVEHDPKMGRKLRFVSSSLTVQTLKFRQKDRLFFKGFLFWWEKTSKRVVDEIQHKAATFCTVASLVPAQE